MEQRKGAAVVIIGGGVTGLSAGWWLARAGVDVLVLEKNIVGWEASGRNGGGATHVYSPFGLEEQRLWPQMDELLGYPTEHQPYRIGVALSEAQLALARRWAEIGETRGFKWELLDRRQLKELVPIVGDNAIGGTYLPFGGHAHPQRTVQAYAWALQDHRGRLQQSTTLTGLSPRGGRGNAAAAARRPVRGHGGPVSPRAPRGRGARGRRAGPGRLPAGPRGGRAGARASRPPLAARSASSCGMAAVSSPIWERWRSAASPTRRATGASAPAGRHQRRPSRRPRRATTDARDRSAVDRRQDARARSPRAAGRGRSRSRRRRGRDRGGARRCRGGADRRAPRRQRPDGDR